MEEPPPPQAVEAGERPVLRRVGTRAMLGPVVSLRRRGERMLPIVDRAERTRKRCTLLKRDNQTLRVQLKRRHDNVDKALSRATTRANEAMAALELCQDILCENKKKKPPKMTRALQKALSEVKQLKKEHQRVVRYAVELSDTSTVRVASDKMLDTELDAVVQLKEEAAQFAAMTEELAQAGRTWAAISWSENNRLHVEPPPIPGYLTFSPFTAHDQPGDRDDVNAILRKEGKSRFIVG